MWSWRERNRDFRDFDRSGPREISPALFFPHRDLLKLDASHAAAVWKLRVMKPKAVSQLTIRSAPSRLKEWRTKASQSDMTLKSWVEHSLDAAPVLEIKVSPRDQGS